MNEAGQMHDVTEAGTAIGGLGGLAVGLSLFFVAGVGPVLATGGLLMTLIAGTSLGALAGGLLGTLAALGIPKDQTDSYAEGLRRGGSLVVVQTEEERLDDAREIIERFQPVDLAERAVRWKTMGWNGYDLEAQPLSREQLLAERASTQPASRILP